MKHQSWVKGLVITIVSFGVALCVLISSLTSIDAHNEQAQATALKASVLRATLTCYAIEGRYPQDAEYLHVHYGLLYDRSHFIVTINTFSENLLPDISVMVQGGGVT